MSNRDDKYYYDKDQSNNKLILSKYEFDLFHEENNTPNKIIRVKKIGNLSKGEKWKIFENDKLAFTLEGAKLTNKEKKFLYSAQGISFLINQYKSGIATVSGIKKNIKQALDNSTSK